MNDIRTIRDLIEDRARCCGDEECLFFGDERVTFGEFDLHINRLANGFLKLGVRRSDKVCLLLSNRPEFLYAWFGLNKIGAVMDGYFKDPEAMRQALQNGFLYTGERAFHDEEGYIFFAGRGRDILRKKGHNIAAAEVEEVLHAHPGILEAAVIGVPSSYGDDEINAFVVFREGRRVGEEDLRQWCAERLAEYKVPRFVEAVAALPKNAMGRVMKNRLQEWRSSNGPAA